MSDKYVYDILKETFCIYCQKSKETPNKLQSHIMKVHKDSYAAAAIREKRAENGK